jgi:hypothetical protein
MGNRDWVYVHEDYDGPEDRRCGLALSREGAINEVDMLIEELGEE